MLQGNHGQPSALVPASADNLNRQKDNGDPERVFANLVECNNYLFPFVDKYSRFGVVFDSGMPLGLGMAQIRSAEATFQVTCSTLRLWLEEDGRPVSVNRNRVLFLPWCVEEGAELLCEGGAVRIRAPLLLRRRPAGIGIHPPKRHAGHADPSPSFSRSDQRRPLARQDRDRHAGVRLL